jgi:hypothetical protein
MKNTDPLMGAKFKSKTHLLNTFLIFGAVFMGPFFARLASKFEKRTNMTYTNFFFQSKKVSKNAEFHADFKSIEKSFKKMQGQKKVISKTSLTNMTKSGKSANFQHVFANNFFWYIFK